MYRAIKEFNQYGYNWYAQVWVGSYNNWFDIEWMKIKYPQGFTNPDDAIRIAQED